MKKTGEILIEINESIIQKESLQKFEAFCSECKQLREFITPKTAAVFLRSSERKIFRLIEEGKIHFVETDQIWICSVSIKNG